MLKQMSDLKVRDGKNGGVKENVVQNAISSNGNSKTSEGWVTVQKKEKPEKQRFARKGRHGLAWRVPHDSTRGKKHLVKKQEKKKKLTDSKDPLVNQRQTNIDFGKDAAVDEQEVLPKKSALLIRMVQKHHQKARGQLPFFVAQRLRRVVDSTIAKKRAAKKNIQAV